MKVSEFKKTFPNEYTILSKQVSFTIIPSVKGLVGEECCTKEAKADLSTLRDFLEGKGEIERTGRNYKLIGVNGNPFLVHLKTARTFAPYLLAKHNLALADRINLKLRELLAGGYVKNTEEVTLMEQVLTNPDKGFINVLPDKSMFYLSYSRDGIDSPLYFIYPAALIQKEEPKKDLAILGSLVDEIKQTLLQRGTQYDAEAEDGIERSMPKIVEAFKAITGKELTEVEGHTFMVCLKLVRYFKNPEALHKDSLLDGASYMALALEANELLKKDK